MIVEAFERFMSDSNTCVYAQMKPPTELFIVTRAESSDASSILSEIFLNKHNDDIEERDTPS